MSRRWSLPGTGLSVLDSEPEAPAPGEVRLAPAFTGICGTDLHALHGAFDQRIGAGTVLGHEVSAVVADVGADVSGWEVGEHVAVFPQHPDGTCTPCRRGHSHVCRGMDFAGLDSPGSLQDWWNVPAANLARLPAGLDLAVGALVEPTAVAVHDVERAEVRRDERVLIIGGGPVGVLIACVAAARGADVRVVEPNPIRREAVQRLGFTVWHPDELPDRLQRWASGDGADVVFEVSGSAPGVQSAVEAAAVRGRVSIVGIHPTPRPIDLHRVFERELTLVGARLYERRDFDTAVEFVARPDFPGRRLITSIVTLDGLADSAQRLSNDPTEMKVLVAGAGVP